MPNGAARTYRVQEVNLRLGPRVGAGAGAGAGLGLGLGLGSWEVSETFCLVLVSLFLACSSSVLSPRPLLVVTAPHTANASAQRVPGFSPAWWYPTAPETPWSNCRVSELTQETCRAHDATPDTWPEGREWAKITGQGQTKLCDQGQESEGGWRERDRQRQRYRQEWMDGRTDRHIDTQFKSATLGREFAGVACTFRRLWSTRRMALESFTSKLLQRTQWRCGIRGGLRKPWLRRCSGDHARA